MTEWNPIETAPKDGQRLLVWSEWFGTTMIAFWQDFGGYKCWEGENGHRKLKPTHWMPLPKAPRDV